MSFFSNARRGRGCFVCGLGGVLLASAACLNAGVIDELSREDYRRLTARVSDLKNYGVPVTDFKNNSPYAGVFGGNASSVGDALNAFAKKLFPDGDDVVGGDAKSALLARIENMVQAVGSIYGDNLLKALKAHKTSLGEEADLVQVIQAIGKSIDANYDPFSADAPSLPDRLKDVTADIGAGDTLQEALEDLQLAFGDSQTIEENLLSLETLAATLKEKARDGGRYVAGSGYSDLSWDDFGELVEALQAGFERD